MSRQDPPEMHANASFSAAQARDRLAHTRRELLRQMVHRRPDGEERLAQDEQLRQAAGEPAEPHEDSAAGGPGELWQDIQRAAGSWWRTHPARLALEMVGPVFDRYARRHPMRTLAFSAAAGAALVLLRPWRLISVTGLLVAAVKSTQMSALAAQMLRPQPPGPMRPPEREPAAARAAEARAATGGAGVSSEAASGPRR